MLGLGMQKYVHAWGDFRSRKCQKQRSGGEAPSGVWGIPGHLRGCVFNIAAGDAPTTCGYVTPPLAYPQVLSTTWKTYRCVIHRILITCDVITRWHKDP